MNFEEMTKQLDRVTEASMAKCRTGRRMKDLIEKIGWMEKLKKKHGITTSGHSTGFSEKEQKWYGWSHRAVVGFGIGDMIFEVDFGDDETPFVKHGSKPIKNMADAEKSAKRFAEYVS